MPRFAFVSSFMRRVEPARRFARSAWNRYRTLPTWLQMIIGVVAIMALLMGLSSITRGNTANSETTFPTVTIASLRSLSGTVSTIPVVGSVRSITEAELLAQSSGTVTSVRTKLGASVPPGFVIAELENASQRAAVLQAEGQYEAAVAARKGASVTDIAATARNTYATAYSTLDTLLKSYIDTFYGDPITYGPTFLIGYGSFDYAHFPTRRQELTRAMDAWRARLTTADSIDPETLLDEADAALRRAIALGNDIAAAATRINSDATSAQLAALASARSGFTTLQASVTAAKLAFQGQNTSATAGADASVKIALGTLRAAQAQYEKTLVRAPIGGTVNFLPIQVGDYVTALSHVATIAQNGTLEIVAYISETHRPNVSVGTEVLVDEQYPAVITQIAPALDPVTKQIEIRVALTSASPLVSGQSVRIALPSEAPSEESSGPLLLPLTALKLTPSARVLFSIGADDRLLAHPVEIGDVRGDRIEILTSLPTDLQIVTDARGLSEGQKVNVSSAFTL